MINKEPQSIHPFDLDIFLLHHGMKLMGTILKPDTTWGFEVYANANFCRNFNRLDKLHPDMARSTSGFVILTEICPSQRVGHFKAPC